MLPRTVCLLTQLMCLSGDTGTAEPDGFLGKVTSLEELHICRPTKDDEYSHKFMQDLGNQGEIRVLDLTGSHRFRPTLQ
jgi:hypothetical protein